MTFKNTHVLTIGVAILILGVTFAVAGTALAPNELNNADDGVSPTDESNVSLLIQPPDVSVAAGEELELDVVVDVEESNPDLDDIGSLEFDATIDDSVARFVDAEAFDGNFDPTIEDDFLSYAFAFANFNGLGEVVVGSVTVEATGDIDEETAIDIDDESVAITDESGDFYGLTAVEGSEITVVEPEVSLSFDLDEESIVPGESSTFDIVIEGADREEGLDTVGFDATVDDSIINFVDAESDAGVLDVDVADGSLSYSLSDADFDAADEMVIGNLTVEAQQAINEEAMLEIDDTSVELADTDDRSYGLIDAMGSELTIEIDVDGNGLPAQDLAEDGLLEDVNGLGDVRAADAQVLFFERNNLDENDALLPYFNFSGGNNITSSDAQALFFERNDRNP